MLMTATIERLPEATAVVTFSGAMALGTSLKIADSQVRAAIADGVTRLVFDLTAVDYRDSAGLGMIVFTYGAVRENVDVTAPALEDDGTPSALQHKRAEAALEMAQYYEDARKLAHMMTEWSMKLPGRRHRFVVTSGGGPGMGSASIVGSSLYLTKRLLPKANGTQLQ